MSNYPTKSWYIAGLSDDIGPTPLERRFLGEDTVLWRGAGGQVTAFENRCAHRGFPLSHGSIEGDRLICGYHGCVYITNGECVDIPSQTHVPTGMSVPVFPILEEPPFVWIWLGPPGAAAASRPPTVPWVNDPQWETFTSAWTVSANYLMVHEHYLDFSYAPIVHAGDIPETIRAMPAFSDVEVTETTVAYTRILPDAPLTDWEADATGLDCSLTYRRQEMGTFASPALHLQRWDIHTPSGNIYSTSRVHGITPKTDASTHVFMAGSRNYAPGQQAVTYGLKRFLNRVAQRDISVLETASDHSGYHRWRAGVEFQADAAVMRARRIVNVLLANEARPDESHPTVRRETIVSG